MDTIFIQVLNDASERVRFRTAIDALSKTQRRAVLSFIYRQGYTTPGELTRQVKKRLADHSLNRESGNPDGSF